ncbi:hypothetical protein JW865_09440 [Candidatus Bathyarchaeota archaeon]|nr:hypothetical protein [Candidatus Bathyarchaeota archaeon]
MITTNTLEAINDFELNANECDFISLGSGFVKIYNDFLDSDRNVSRLFCMLDEEHRGRLIKIINKR